MMMREVVGTTAEREKAISRKCSKTWKRPNRQWVGFKLMTWRVELIVQLVFPYRHVGS